MSRKRMWWLVSVATLVLASCAPQYRLSDNAQALRRDMSREQATRTLAGLIVPSPGQGGLCYDNDWGNPKPGQQMSKQSVADGRITYSGLQVRVIKSETSGALLTLSYDAVPARGEVVLSEVSKISIGRWMGCARLPGKHDVLLFRSSVRFVAINVAPENLDALLAALLVFAPGASVVVGSNT